MKEEEKSEAESKPQPITVTSHRKIEPIHHESDTKDEKKDDISPEQTSTAPDIVPEIKLADEKPDKDEPKAEVKSKTGVAVSKSEDHEKIEVKTKPKPEPIPDEPSPKAEGDKRVEEPAAEEATPQKDAEESAAQEDTAKPDDEVAALQRDETKDIKPDGNQNETDIEAQKKQERDEELEKLAESHKYYLPINQLERRRNKRATWIGAFVIIVLCVAWADVALDAGLVSVPGVKAPTHFFSK